MFLTRVSDFRRSARFTELIAASHEVIGLNRWIPLPSFREEAHFGSSEDLDSLEAGAAKADRVIQPVISVSRPDPKNGYDNHRFGYVRLSR